MKKTFLSALLVGFVGLAQATTVVWNDVKADQTYGAKGQVTLSTPLSKEGFSLKLAIDFTQVPTSISGNWWPALMGVSTSASTQSNLTANLSGDNVLRLDTKHGGTNTTQTTVSSGVSLTAGRHEFILSFDGSTLQLAYDGSVIAQAENFSLAYDPNLVSWGQQAGYPNNTYLDNNNQFQYAIESFQYANEAVLPEPTVLALLALGVAGLALRRKVR